MNTALLALILLAIVSPAAFRDLQILVTAVIVVICGLAIVGFLVTLALMLSEDTRLALLSCALPLAFVAICTVGWTEARRRLSLQRTTRIRLPDEIPMPPRYSPFVPSDRC